MTTEAILSSMFHNLLQDDGTFFYEPAVEFIENSKEYKLVQSLLESVRKGNQEMSVQIQKLCDDVNYEERFDIIGVANGLFSTGIDFGKIITLCVFVREIAQRQIHPHILKELIDDTIKYIGSLNSWITSHGGLEGIQALFNHGKEVEVQSGQEIQLWNLDYDSWSPQMYSVNQMIQQEQCLEVVFMGQNSSKIFSYTQYNAPNIGLYITLCQRDPDFVMQSYKVKLKVQPYSLWLGCCQWDKDNRIISNSFTCMNGETFSIYPDTKLLLCYALYESLECFPTGVFTMIAANDMQTNRIHCCIFEKIQVYVDEFITKTPLQ